MAELRFSMESVDACVVVAISGELDVTCNQQFDDCLAEASAASDLIILDMSGVDFMDTTALAVIVSYWRRQVDAGGTSSWPARVTVTPKRSGSPASLTGCRCTATSPRP